MLRKQDFAHDDSAFPGEVMQNSGFIIQQLFTGTVCGGRNRGPAGGAADDLDGAVVDSHICSPFVEALLLRGSMSVCVGIPHVMACCLVEKVLAVQDRCLRNLSFCLGRCPRRTALRTGAPSAKTALRTGALSAKDRFKRRRLCFVPKVQRGCPPDSPASQSALMNVGSAHI